MQLQRGMREKLDQYLNCSAPIEIEMTLNGPDTYDFCCFGVDANNKLSDDRYMIFYNQENSPAGEISYQNPNGIALFTVGLSRLPANIQKLVFTASIDGSGAMGNIKSHTVAVKQNGKSVFEMNFSCMDFKQEKAIIAIEIYRKDGWRINAVARGFNGGLDALLREYGGEEAKPDSAPSTPPPAPKPAPKPVPQPAPQPQKVDLRKGQKVSLVKGQKGLGEIVINLNWRQPKGFFASPIDLDLGCLYELKDGTKSSLQPLGNKFGSLDKPPYIALDGDDRTGANATGETMRINGKFVSKIRRVLVYTYIYDGIANWKGADGIVTVKCPGNPEIIVRMDEYGSSLPLCVICLLENVNDTLSVQKVVDFYEGQHTADAAFGWGLQWRAGRK